MAKKTNTFLERGAFEAIPNSDRWIVTKRVVYVDDLGLKIIAPVGFTTDFASVPSLARIFGGVLAVVFLVAVFFPHLFIPCLLIGVFSWGVIMIAEWLENSGTDEIAAIHDQIYATRERGFFSANWILFRGMAASGATMNPMWKRILFWINVTLFGVFPWIGDARRRKRLTSTS